MAKDQQHPAQAGVDQRRKVMEEQNAEYYKRSEATSPTLQAENDQAKVGMPVEPEPDGSDPEHVTVRRVMESRVPGPTPMHTCSMDQQRPPAPAPRPAQAPEPRSDDGSAGASAPAMPAEFASAPVVLDLYEFCLDRCVPPAGCTPSSGFTMAGACGASARSYRRRSRSMASTRSRACRRSGTDFRLDLLQRAFGQTCQILIS